MHITKRTINTYEEQNRKKKLQRTDINCFVEIALAKHADCMNLCVRLEKFRNRKKNKRNKLTKQKPKQNQKMLKKMYGGNK